MNQPTEDPRAAFIPVEERLPEKGKLVRIAWIINGRFEKVISSEWKGDHWKGWWTPTHWALPL